MLSDTAENTLQTIKFLTIDNSYNTTSHESSANVILHLLCRKIRYLWIYVYTIKMSYWCVLIKSPFFYQNSRCFSCPHRERALSLCAHEQPCLFVLRDWKWRRAETKAITWVCKRECAVIETQKPVASYPRSYLGFTATDGIQVGHAKKGFS